VPSSLKSQIQHQLTSWTEAAGRFQLCSHVANYELLCTLLSEIEDFVNSRPLSDLSADTSNPIYLSFGHFHIGEPLTQLSYNDITNVKGNCLSRIQIYQQQEKNSGRVGQATNTRACSNVIDG